MSHKIKKSQKKKMNKKMIIPVAAFATLVVIAGAVGVSKADDDEKKNTLTQKLAERFNLNQGDVEDVFSQHRNERQNQRQINFEERLSQAVSSGKLTEEQKNLILKKKNELQSQRELFKDLSSDERREKIKGHREEMKKWAEENDINMEEFMFMGKKGGFGGDRHGQRLRLHNN